MNMETKMEKRILIIAGAIIVLLAAYQWSANHKIFNDPVAAAHASKACAVDLHAIILEGVTASSTVQDKQQIASDMFDHYFSAYTKIASCPTDGLLDYRLVSVGDVKDIANDRFTADITFDLHPTAMSYTEWTSPEAREDAFWLRGKKGTLSLKYFNGNYYLDLGGLPSAS